MNPKLLSFCFENDSPKVMAHAIDLISEKYKVAIFQASSGKEWVQKYLSTWEAVGISDLGCGCVCGVSDKSRLKLNTIEQLTEFFRGKFKGNEPIMIGNNVVLFDKKGIKVGCTEVPLATIKAIAKRFGAKL